MGNNQTSSFAIFMVCTINLLESGTYMVHRKVIMIEKSLEDIMIETDHFLPFSALVVWRCQMLTTSTMLSKYKCWELVISKIRKQRRCHF